jgi:hypothetical protein
MNMQKQFLAMSYLLWLATSVGAVLGAELAGGQAASIEVCAGKPNGELLYNGIRLPRIWPGRASSADSNGAGTSFFRRNLPVRFSTNCGGSSSRRWVWATRSVKPSCPFGIEFVSLSFLDRWHAGRELPPVTSI